MATKDAIKFKKKKKKKKKKVELTSDKLEKVRVDHNPSRAVPSKDNQTVGTMFILFRPNNV